MGIFGAVLGAILSNDDSDDSSEYYEVDTCPVCGNEMHKRYSYSAWWCDTCQNDPINPVDFDYDDDSESLSVYEAAQIWMSNGKDEDYTFGYTEEELEDAL